MPRAELTEVRFALSNEVFIDEADAEPLRQLDESVTHLERMRAAFERQGPAISASGRSLPIVKEPIVTVRGAGMGRF